MPQLITSSRHPAELYSEREMQCMENLGLLGGCSHSVIPANDGGTRQCQPCQGAGFLAMAGLSACWVEDLISHPTVNILGLPYPTNICKGLSYAVMPPFLLIRACTLTMGRWSWRPSPPFPACDLLQVT